MMERELGRALASFVYVLLPPFGRFALAGGEIVVVVF